MLDIAVHLGGLAQFYEHFLPSKWLDLFCLGFTLSVEINLFLLSP